MFDGGGVPIDHYIIQVDNNTQLETTDLTYSVDVMYNDTLFFFVVFLYNLAQSKEYM